MTKTLLTKNGFIANLNLDIEVERKLSLNLQMIVQGRDDVFMSPMAREHGPDFLISEFTKVYNAGRSRINDVLQDLENSNLLKCGPRSISVPWKERRKSLTDSFISDESVRNLNVDIAPGRGSLRPVSVETALKLLKSNTNSGLPYLTRKGVVKERVLNKFDILLNRKDPCVLFTRTQEQLKTRNVWGYPMADTLNEMRYYSPLLSYQRLLPYRAALVSPEEVNQRLTAIIGNAIKRGYKIQSIDFSAYDTTVKSKLQKIAFDYIKNLFQSKYSDEIDYISKRFGSIGIVTPDGVLTGNHGVPTGSTFTNEVDSIVQALIALSLGINIDDFQIQGDDGVYCLPAEDIAELVKKFKSAGLLVNEDKSYVSNNYAIYLQNLYHEDYKVNGIICGIYPVYRALNRILYQERWSDFEDYSITGKDFYSIRTICILENCKYHPLFEEIVKFVLKYDKYSLEYSATGLKDYVRMINQTQGAEGILRHQYGDNVSGLGSFETVKMIKRLG